MTALSVAKPARRPQCPHFSSGPCAKRPGWSPGVLAKALVGRSHRAKQGKAKLNQVIVETKALLELPNDYRVAIMPASDTGAIEAALWSLLGLRPVDLFAWDSFGKEWAHDCVTQLSPLVTRVFTAEFGELADLSKANFEHDIVFTWNGTTSGVRVPNGDWISANRKGLTICDATSSVFAVPMPWEKLDVVTFSWQKILGGEAQHGILILSPRAIERLKTYRPVWPIPKIFRLTKNGDLNEQKLDEKLFEGSTINTPSMLCVEDALDAMQWARSMGGAQGLALRTQKNFSVMQRWVDRSAWIDFLAKDPSIRSVTSVCLAPSDPDLRALPQREQTAFFNNLTGKLEAEAVAFDINAYRDAPAGLRIWCGATVESEDVTALTEWLDWAYATAKAEMFSS